jgi:uncharacterized membrane protein YdfJ with MMPL/SSD domain
MMAAGALVILGILLVVFGIFASVSYPLIGFGILALIAAGILQVVSTRRS